MMESGGNFFCNVCASVGCLLEEEEEEDDNDGNPVPIDEDQDPVGDPASAKNAASGSLSREGWPDFNLGQLEQFKKWYPTERTRHLQELEHALSDELSQAEAAQALDNALESRSHIARAKELRARIGVLDCMEHMRTEAWRYYDKECGKEPHE